MKWCPSLNNDDVTEPKFQDRLGLLAVACSDGCVRILAISKKLFESSEPKMFLAKYSFTLKRSSNTSIGKFGLLYGSDIRNLGFGFWINGNNFMRQVEQGFSSFFF